MIHGVPNAHNIAEIAWGTNPKARITGNIGEDKKLLGSVHIGIGRNIAYGGTIDSPIHLDCVILKPTVEVDGMIVIKKGQLID
jgi:leucyl aminopeptidase (aminopeptidase T)